MKKKIFVTGHKGLVGSSILKMLKKNGYKTIVRAKHELNLLNQDQVNSFFKRNKPDIVIHAAGKVGGILHNQTYPAQFIFENSQMALNVINNCHIHKVKKLINLGSACIYPKLAKQPLKESYLLNGKLESSNEAYAIAKILSLKMTEYYKKQFKCNFLSLQPTNLYGTNDNFNIKSGHVIPSLINKFHDGKINKKKYVEVWGSGNVKREFLFVDDLADAVLFLLTKKTNHNIINVGSGEEVTIKNLSKLIASVIGFKGKIIFNRNYPDGTPRKIVDTTILSEMGWRHKTKLKEGLLKVYKSFRN